MFATNHFQRKNNNSFACPLHALCLTRKLAGTSCRSVVFGIPVSNCIKGNHRHLYNLKRSLVSLGTRCVPFTIVQAHLCRHSSGDTFSYECACVGSAPKSLNMKCSYCFQQSQPLSVPKAENMDTKLPRVFRVSCACPFKGGAS